MFFAYVVYVVYCILQYSDVIPVIAVIPVIPVFVCTLLIAQHLQLSAAITLCAISWRKMTATVFLVLRNSMIITVIVACETFCCSVVRSTMNSPYKQVR